MPWTEPTIKCDAPITPRDPDDTYASHLANYGRGGHHTVTAYADLAEIPADRLEVGMTATVTGTQRIYQLTSADPVTWEALSGSGGSGFFAGRV